VTLHSIHVSPNAPAKRPACRWRVWRVGQTKVTWLRLLATVLGEYRRAIVAARRYEELKLHRELVVLRHSIPRRIFEECYSRIDADRTGGGDNATMQLENRRSRRLPRRHLLAGQ
jgi:hypothetical protein